MAKFLLVVTLYFFVFRIKNTPKVLNSKNYRNYINKIIDAQRESLNNISPKYIATYKIFMALLICLIYTFYITYCCLIGSYFSTSIIVILLTILELCTVIINCSCILLEYLYMEEIARVGEKWVVFKHRRLWLIINSILDYVFYITIIYLLLEKLT